ncbi:zinc finger CCCH domain-containing 10-like, partial [Paramuricea clavata]
MSKEGENDGIKDKQNDEQICQDFQQGVCSSGDKCKFAHPSGMESEPKDQPKICRDFQNGTCYRSTCKYLHMMDQDEKDYLWTGQLPSNTRGGRRCNSGVQVCIDFNNNKCNRGVSCKFLHVPKEAMYGGGGGYYDEPPWKRPHWDVMGNIYQYLMEENVFLRRKVLELRKDVADLRKDAADLRATGDTLTEQIAQYRRSGGSSPVPYGG